MCQTKIQTEITALQGCVLDEKTAEIKGGLMVQWSKRTSLSNRERKVTKWRKRPRHVNISILKSDVYSWDMGTGNNQSGGRRRGGMQEECGFERVQSCTRFWRFAGHEWASMSHFKIESYVSYFFHISCIYYILTLGFSLPSWGIIYYACLFFSDCGSCVSLGYFWINMCCEVLLYKYRRM